MFGPGDHFNDQHSHVMAAIIKKIFDAHVKNKRNIVLWGSGTPRREFVYCDDAADASIFAMAHAGELKNTPYNIGMGVDFSIRDIAEIVAHHVGYKGKITWDRSKPDGVMRKLLDAQAFFKLGWRPQTDINRGIAQTVQYYALHGND
jgi:GDP-L-fucose synthase